MDLPLANGLSWGWNEVDKNQDAQLAEKAALEHVLLTVKYYGAKVDGVTDDTIAIQKNADAGTPIVIPGKVYITQPIVFNNQSQRIKGYGKGSSTQYLSQIYSDQDIEFIQVKANFCTIEGLSLYCSSPTHSKKHIQSYSATDMKVIDCRIEGVDAATTGSGIGFTDGAGNYGGSMGLVDKCILSHASIDIQSSDIHVTNSWVWANSRPYGIKISGSSSNITLQTVDILPPRKDVPNAIAGLYITGAAAQPKILGCYFDGNFGLATGTGCLIENGTLAPLMSDCHFNGLDSHALILDSLICPIVSNCTFYNNNQSADGSVDILLRQTFSQPMEKPLIEGGTHIQTSALSGTIGPSIKVQTGTQKKRMRIIDNTIHQPGTGGGYSDVEILLEDGYFANTAEGSLKGNGGTRTVYSSSGNTSVAANATFQTVNFLNTMAYIPRLDQYQTAVEGVGAESITYRLQKNDVSSIQFGFPATHADFTLHFNVSL